MEIIKNKDIETQEEIADELKKEGFNVTQATVSRDIKNLKLIKVQGESGKYKYEAPTSSSSLSNSKINTLISSLAVSVENVDKMVIIKTVSAGAGPVAEVIDGLNNSNIAGTIAGENTIFVMVRTILDAEQLVITIRKMIN